MAVITLKWQGSDKMTGQTRNHNEPQRRVALHPIKCSYIRLYTHTRIYTNTHKHSQSQKSRKPSLAQGFNMEEL